MPSNSTQAIQAALNQQWDEAVEHNLSILTDQPNDIATLNRLAFAYKQVGNLSKAKSTYNQVLKIDKYNPIAQKSLQKLGQLKNGSVRKNDSHRVITTFIEEPGKTKTIALVRPASSSVLVSLDPGLEVSLISKKRKVMVETTDGEYIGCLPDDLGFKLGKLISFGYAYQSVIKNSDDKSVTIFIRELERTRKGNNLPSFSTNISTLLSTPSQALIEEIPIDTTPTGEDEEFDQD